MYIIISYSDFIVKAISSSIMKKKSLCCDGGALEDFTLEILEKVLLMM